MLQAHHKLRNNEVVVWIGFEEAFPLKKWMEEEAGLDLMNIKMAERDNLEEKKDELKNLLKSEDPKVIFCDEFKNHFAHQEHPDDPVLTWLSELAGKQGSDIVLCLPKEPEFSNGVPPNVVLLSLGNPHRQGYQPHMMAQYLSVDMPKTDLSDLHHQGRPTLWLNFDKEATAREMMKKVKEQLVIVGGESRTWMPSTGMVICKPSDKSEELRETLPDRWTVEDYFSIFGAEAEVTVAHV